MAILIPQTFTIQQEKANQSVAAAGLGTRPIPTDAALEDFIRAVIHIAGAIQSKLQEIRDTLDGATGTFSTVAQTANTASAFASNQISGTSDFFIQARVYIKLGEAFVALLDEIDTVMGSTDFIRQDAFAPGEYLGVPVYKATYPDNKNNILTTSKLTVENLSGNCIIGNIVIANLIANSGTATIQVDSADTGNLELLPGGAGADHLIFDGLKWPTADGSAAQVLKTDGSAQLAFASVSVDELSDADTTTNAPALNEVLKWNGSNWVPGTAGDTTEFTFSIDSFSDGIADTSQLIGAGVWKAIAAISFTATYSNAPGGMTAEVAMSGSATAWAGNLSMTPVTGPETNTEAVEYPATTGNSVTFTLSQSADASTSVESVAFNNTMRYGNSALTQGNQTEASLEALSEVGGPNESRSQTISNIATTASYLVFAYADRLSDVAQVQRNSGSGYVTASFNATRTTVAPSIQAGVAAVDNSAAYSEAFACVTSTDTGLADGSNDFKLLTSGTAQNYLYWGELNKASGYTEADVEGNYATQPGKTASNSISNRSMTVNAGASEYTYIAYPTRLGSLSSIVIGGFESLGDFNIDSTTLSITNDAGFQENYSVYVSKNPGFTDPTTMTVSL